jgi:glutamyl-tRNA reductase
MTRAIVKKVLHGPLSHLRGLAQSGDEDATRTVLRAFGEAGDEESDG